MFTGIVQGKFPIIRVEDKPGLRVFDLLLSDELANGVKQGASIAVNGVCLTAVRIQGNQVGFDIMQETLNITTLGRLQKGDLVNVERSVRMGDEIGGHVMSGHVSTMAEIVAMETPENNHMMTFHVDLGWMKYLFSKGFIGLDGASLTVVDADKEKNTFKVWLIPETLKLTTFGEKNVGDLVNVEIDSGTQTIVETIELYLKEKHV